MTYALSGNGHCAAESLVGFSTGTGTQIDLGIVENGLKPKSFGFWYNKCINEFGIKGVNTLALPARVLPGLTTKLQKIFFQQFGFETDHFSISESSSLLKQSCELSKLLVYNLCSLLNIKYEYPIKVVSFEDYIVKEKIVIKGQTLLSMKIGDFFENYFQVLKVQNILPEQIFFLLGNYYNKDIVNSFKGKGWQKIGINTLDGRFKDKDKIQHILDLTVEEYISEGYGFSGKIIRWIGENMIKLPEAVQLEKNGIHKITGLNGGKIIPFPRVLVISSFENENNLHDPQPLSGLLLYRLAIRNIGIFKEIFEIYCSLVSRYEEYLEHRIIIDGENLKCETHEYDPNKGLILKN